MNAPLSFYLSLEKQIKIRVKERLGLTVKHGHHLKPK
jgi:hypothetical protein